MPFFQIPAPTRFDLNFSVAGIPVRVHPLFWVIAILFGSASASFIDILLWIFVIFISILVHELGHAFAFRRFGQDSYVVLHLMGGLAVPISNNYDGGYARLTPNQNIFISLAGPFAGFFLALLIILAGVGIGGQLVISILWVFPIPNVVLPFEFGMLGRLFGMFVFVNFFWGFINLLPVFPLDGGNVARYTLIQVDPINGIRNSLWLSVIVGILIAIAGYIFLQSIYMAFLFGYLAFQSFQALQYRI